MSTAFAAIESAIVAALQAAPAVAGGAIMRNRQRPLTASVNAAVVVHLEDSRAAETVLGYHDWFTVFAVECYAKASPTGGAADADAHALLAECYARLSTLHIAEHGVMQSAMQPAIEWQRHEDGAASVCAVLRLAVLHRTPANTLKASP